MGPEHLTGIDVIDKQHQEIFDVAESAVEAIQSGDKWHVVHYILVRLHELSRIHFAVEEGLMQALGYPETKAHQKLHLEYLAEIAKLRDATLNEDSSATSSLNEHNVAFLIHILDHDKRLADYLKAR